MTVTRARPVAEANSNKHILFVLGLTATPSPEAFHLALALHEKISDRYPRRQEHRAGPVAFDPNSQTMVPANPGLTGFAFDYVRPDGQVRRAISCNGDIVQLGCTQCGDLDQFQRDALAELSLIASILEQPVQSISAERLDRFLWDGDYADFGAEHVLRIDSKWVTPNVFDAKDLWHSYHGLFKYLNEPHRHRLLHVVEVSAKPPRGADPPEIEGTVVVDVKQSMTVVHGKLSHSEEPPPMSIEQLAGEGDENGLLHDYMPKMFDRSSETLASIVNDELCGAIGLAR